MGDETQAQLPAPDPALRRLDRFTGRWNMEGHLVGSGEIGGGWRPNPGADETVNVPYDIGGRRPT